jgi:phage baseplate assembly protein W
MNAIFHEWGADLAVDSRGDLALASGSDMISQRICRRLLTNPGDYLWNRDYGGGLAGFVGTPVKAADIEAVTRTQLLLEESVPTTPPPRISVSAGDAAGGNVTASITYSDPMSLLPITLDVTPR